MPLPALSRLCDMRRLQHQTLSFNDFTVDLTRGSLFRGDAEIKLRPKSFETLKHLVQNNGRLVSKNELMDAVWAGIAVTDDSLVQCLIEIRRALGEGGQQIIKTVPRRGYIFDADVTRNDLAGHELIFTDEVEGVRVTIEEDAEEHYEEPTPVQPVAVPASRRGSWLLSKPLLALSASIVIAVVALVVWLLWKGQDQIRGSEVRTLAVLPFKSQIPENQDDYLGLGIANEIITKVSQTGTLTVRPTSAVRKYTKREVDALEAARELNVDAVLDGTYLRVGDQLRITVNLLRVADGTSLWAEKFDEQFTDIFSIQEQVSHQVAQRLRSKLGAAEQARLRKRYTSDPQAYSYYAKGMYHFFNIGPSQTTRSEADLAIDLFKRAIELDGNYALARAQLGYTYTKIAVFLEDNPGLIEEARNQLGLAERIDPELAEVHLARYFIAFSQYEGWSVGKAMRELRLAQQLDPNAGHSELGDLYAHIGLEQKAKQEYQLALSNDPNNFEVKSGFINSYFISGRPDDAREATKLLFNHEPDLRYLIEKGMIKEAAPLITQEVEKDPGAVWKMVYQVLLMAMQGKHREAQAAIPKVLEKERRYRGYHHDTYNIARIYALDGKSEEAIKWLRVTVVEGLPNYPLIERDFFLDRIREDPAFKQFLAELKMQWEGYQREFG